ncbi:MAG: DUF5666 domain-containing protein [Anaerolineales bacterium]
MFKRSFRIVLLVSLLSFTLVGIAYAQDDALGAEIRRAGVITTVDLPGDTFTLRMVRGGDVHVHVTGSTEFRSPDGELSGFEDLEPGMRAMVIGEQRGDGTIQASQVTAVRAEDLPPSGRVFGQISGVSAFEGTFSLQTRDGRSLTFHVTDRTQFRDRDGAVQSIGDLETGMQAMVLGYEKDGEWDALLVVAGFIDDDIKERIFRVKGEITGSVPGQDTFSLVTHEGETYTFQVSDRTRFRSPDGTVTSIHDLKKGMTALVGAIETEEHGNLALLVAAGQPAERPERPSIDIRAGGIVRSLGGDTLTIETRNGESITFLVDENTVYRSRDGSISGYADLETGLIALVGGSKLGDGDLLARWVGAGKPPARTNAEEAGRPPSIPDSDS